MKSSNSCCGGDDLKQISFQEFKNKFLEPGLVERIEVTNKSLAKVYVYTGEWRHSMENGVGWCLH